MDVQERSRLIHVAEGKRKEVTLTRVESDRRVRELALLDRGCVCEVCAFDFGKRYGNFAKMCVEVHHLEALGGAGGRKISMKLDDGGWVQLRDYVIVVCPNCHRALHQSTDPSDWKAFQKECDIP